MSSQSQKKKIKNETEEQSEENEEEEEEVPDIEDITQQFLYQFQKIKEMRKDIHKEGTAPVDSLGCAKLPENRSPKEHRFELLAALMLSAQTRDEITGKAMSNLQNAHKKYFNSKKPPIQGTLCDYLCSDDVTEAMIMDLIHPVGFYKRKASYLKDTANTCKTEYDGDIPSDLKGLLKLKGVGPKMAYLALQHGWNKMEGIGVDVHVFRISSKILRWTYFEMPNSKSKNKSLEAKNPEEARKKLEIIAPKETWPEINETLVGFGQVICKPVGPKCEQCQLSTDKKFPCWFYSSGKRFEKKRKISKMKSSKKIEEEEEIEIEEMSETESEDSEDSEKKNKISKRKN